MTKKKVCIVGGGATGVALLWALSQDPQASQEWDITLIHDQPSVGGHSLTYNVSWNGKYFPVDIGVQFISPMLYPNVHVMLQRSEFKSRVPITNYDQLKIACAFPAENNSPLNWGNFPDYQQGPNFALYSEDMQFDIGAFQSFIEVSLLTGWGNKTLQDYFNDPPTPYRNQDQFINYILAPYLSIINGYGASLLDQTTFIDLFPLFATLPLPQSWGFPTPLGSFSNPGIGWQRFTNGAQSWVQAMSDVAQSYVPATILLNSEVNAVWTDPASGQVTVQWTSQNNQNSDTFDKVVLTTDMWTNSQILNNQNNEYFWNNLYVNYVGYGQDENGNPLGQPVVWPLMWGQCFIHSDSSLLSPDLMEQEETLQFNAYFAPGTANGNYDLSKTFTTYIQKNVLGDPDADGLYLTMYGYIPNAANGDKVPSNVLFQEPWTHGKWTPSFMSGPKAQLYLAQGLGNISYTGQMNTNVYFAGNNTTADSEEGALDSAMAIANYAFGVEYPLIELSPESLFAYTMYTIYHNVMFPKQNTGHAIAALYQTLPEKQQSAIMPAAMIAAPQMEMVARPKKRSTAARKKIAVKKASARPRKIKMTTAKKKTAVKPSSRKPARSTKKTTRKTTGGRTTKKSVAKKTKKR
jgi:hypothetical protein